MPIIQRSLAAALLAGAMLSGCAGEPSPDSDDYSRRLIEALGSETYSVREAASRALGDMGRAAIEPLEYAARSEDSETRLQASRLLISMRGRGFMGIMPQEEQPQLQGFSESDDGPSGKPDFIVPCVVVRQIAKLSDTPNANPNAALGEAKPFPAEAAGMQAGDKVLEINGREIRGFRDLLRVVVTTGPGRVAQVLVEREGKKLRLPLVLTHNPADGKPKVDLELEAGAKPRNMLEQPARVVLKQKIDAQPNPDPAGKKDLKQKDDAKIDAGK
jgi:hypothetical protein